MTARGTWVVHVAGFYPPHLGGAERVVQRLAQLQARTRRVTVHTSAAGGGPRTELDWSRRGCWPRCCGTAPRRTCCTCTPVRR
jgi:hypothetical protein